MSIESEATGVSWENRQHMFTAEELSHKENILHFSVGKTTVTTLMNGHKPVTAITRTDCRMCYLDNENVEKLMKLNGIYDVTLNIYEYAEGPQIKGIKSGCETMVNPGKYIFGTIETEMYPEVGLYPFCFIQHQNEQKIVGYYELYGKITVVDQ